MIASIRCSLLEISRHPVCKQPTDIIVKAFRVFELDAQNQLHQGNPIFSREGPVEAPIKQRDLIWVAGIAGHVKHIAGMGIAVKYRRLARSKNDVARHQIGQPPRDDGAFRRFPFKGTGDFLAGMYCMKVTWFVEIGNNSGTTTFRLFL